LLLPINVQKASNDYKGSKELLESVSDPEMKALAQEEYDTLKFSGVLEEELTVLLVPQDPNDTKNFIMEIRAGTGGEEAALFASDLYRMYTASPSAKDGKWNSWTGMRQGRGLQGNCLCSLRRKRVRYNEV